ncbi:DNA gyrase inhibitor YacG [Spartinivicinus poritis]|uniref:DNA gyrase inhibitor YacG n=1 Tax=Spartinivicinus poritis TaxID=2994640 RepID=A0ABT5U8U8_9GAMM|nr:DNA gyrase inhibitor YacG [Spartinivicinus sp. A2-2]MDE1462801.1 DNA gyrase inhibitor YacG [Spartinivicinus sp. A2-2]
MTSAIVKCPTCKKAGPWTPKNEFRPFCSKRCQLIDLGAWADEQHRIPGDPAYLPDEELLAEYPSDQLV